MPKNTQSTVIDAGKLLLWHAMVRDDIADATKKLSHEVTAPTMNIAKLEHLQQYLIDARMLLLRKSPAYQLANGNCSLDVNVYVDSDWAVCEESQSQKHEWFDCECPWMQPCANCAGTGHIGTVL